MRHAGCKPVRMPLTQGWISNRWSMLVLRGAAAVVFGLLTLASPRTAVTAVVFLFAIYAIVDGVTSALFALSAPEPERGVEGTVGRASGAHGSALRTRGFYLARGAVGIGAGIAAFLHPEVTSLAFAVLAGCWAALAGASELALALRLRREGAPRVAGLVVAGLAALLLGLALLFAPTLGILATGGVVAALALASGLSSLSVAARLHDRRTGGDDPLAPRAGSRGTSPAR